MKFILVLIALESLTVYMSWPHQVTIEGTKVAVYDSQEDCEAARQARAKGAAADGQGELAHLICIPEGGKILP